MVNAATPTALDSQSVGVCSVIRKMYWATTIHVNDETVIRDTLTDDIATDKGQNDSLNRKSDREKVLWLGKGLFEVDDVGPGSRGKVRGKLEVHRDARQGDQQTDDPVEHCQTD